jgi:hypothetical protein
MREESATKVSVRHRAAQELKEFLALTAYLYICLGALMLLKTAILQDAGVSYTAWGVAAVKALVLAKFMLLGLATKMGTRYKDKPLIWPTLHMALLFFILLLALTTVEELVVGLVHHRVPLESLSHVVGSPFFVGLANSLIMFLILVPYCAFKSLGDVLGYHYLVRMFFVERIDKRTGGAN